MLCKDQLCKFSVIVDIMRQLMMALKFCHQKGYAHKAINPQHIMVFKLESPNSYLIKLTGFGNAQKIGALKINNMINNYSGSVYIAPEAQSSKNIEKLDIWGCGLVFLNLITGENIINNFLIRKDEIIEESVQNTNMSTERKEIVLDFLNKTLEVDPNKRITAQ